MTCSENNSTWEELLASVLGLTAGDDGVVRMKTYADSGDYFSCDNIQPIDLEMLFRLLIDKNDDDKNIIRVNYSADCPTTDLVDCGNNVPDPMALLKRCIGTGPDGGPILRICVE